MYVVNYPCAATAAGPDPGYSFTTKVDANQGYLQGTATETPVLTTASSNSSPASNAWPTDAIVVCVVSSGIALLLLVSVLCCMYRNRRDGPDQGGHGVGPGHGAGQGHGGHHGGHYDGYHEGLPSPASVD